MSFIQSKSAIENGDMVFLYTGIKNVLALQVKRGKISQVRNGAIRHDDLIGKPFGYRYECPRGSVYVLSPSPELWSLSLPHRTQILYSTDISLICSMLYLRPGSQVVEAGTGSGSLSHAIARTIFPSGHLYTFDFHQERVRLANQEFQDHDLAQFITCQQKDVCEQGFDLKDTADAVFLDLPKPWLAIPFAYQALKTRGTTRICCFSPCIEQVQRTTRALQQNRFIDVETYEVLLRPYEFRYNSLRSFDIDQTILIEAIEEATESAMETGDDVESESKEMSAGNENVKCDPQQSPDQIAGLKTASIATKQYLSAIPLNEIAGHTGFLTFATKL